jgi:glutamine synthetase
MVSRDRDRYEERAMGQVRVDYVWLDGHEPTVNLRTKAQLVDSASITEDVSSIPEWGFDGSSTNQAEGHFSDCILKPVRLYNNPFVADAYFVLCEVLNADRSVHISNTRALIDEVTSAEFWFGFEQEYVLMTTNGRPLGFPDGGYPEPQGPYYCAVGTDNVAGREIIDEHWALCLEAGIGVSGINAEVMLGQWEFQVFGKSALRACDDLVMARFMLARVTERYGVVANLDPRPISGDWNGSGMHSNFSFDYLRDVGGEEYIKALAGGFAPFHKEHLAVYGAGNERRLTGAHETASIDKFTFGASDRGASIRIPIWTITHDWKGYLEDRRPASDGDPYLIVNRIMETVGIAHPQALDAIR